MSVTGPAGTPSKTGVAVTDVVAALYATIAVLAALYVRRDTGRGQRVTIDLLHASLALLANQSTGFLASGEVPLALGNVHPSIEPFATYRAADGELMICAGNDAQFRRLRRCSASPRTSASPPTSSASRTARSYARSSRRALAASRGRVGRAAYRRGRPGRTGADDRRGVLARGGARARRGRRHRRRAHGRVPRSPLRDAGGASACGRRSSTSTATRSGFRADRDFDACLLEQPRERTP